MNVETSEDLIHWREAAGFTREQAALFCGISAMQWGRMERGLSRVEKRVQRIVIQWYAIHALTDKLNAAMETQHGN